MMNKPPIPIPKDLNTVTRIFNDAGYQCWLVGGAIRDSLLGQVSKDFDLATNAKPEVMQKLFHRTIPTGIKHGTVTILLGSHQFEATTFRSDGCYSDGRRPDNVSYSDDIREDLARRDFTINAIAWDLINNEIFDPHNGRNDLKRRVIQTIGEPEKRFREDALRVIRACRFVAQLGFTITQSTLDAIKPEHVKGLSVERIWGELKKILISPQPSSAFRLFRETGLLRVLLPELEACSCPPINVLDHCLITCDALPRDKITVRAAALFLDVGKPVVVKKTDDGEITFPRYEIEGASVTKRILKRLKASSADTKRIVRLVRHQKINYTNDWTDAAIRHFMARIGPDILDDLITLRIADLSNTTHGLSRQDTPQNIHSVSSLIVPTTAASSRGSRSSAMLRFCRLEPTKNLRIRFRKRVLNGSLQKELLSELRTRIQKIRQHNDALTIKDLDINGHILMEELDIAPSSTLGTLLQYLLDCVLEYPKNNKKKILLDLSRKWLDG